MRFFSVFLAGAVLVLLAISAMAMDDAAAVKQATEIPDTFHHEIWGQTYYGEGYVYGPVVRRSGMTVVDLDLDGDDDFVFPGLTDGPQLMRNLGSSSAFYPGGSRTLVLDPLPSSMKFSLSMAFADVTGDRLPDLFAVVREDTALRKHVVWFSNQGPRDTPSFQYEGILYTSGQSGRLPGMWVKLGDVNGDGLQDLFVAEDFVYETERPHRLFWLENAGDSTNPDWQAAAEIEALSALLPQPLAYGKIAMAASAVPTHRPVGQLPAPREKNGQFTYNLGDIALADWDSDGVLDFLFYNRSEGLMWVPNVGTATAPDWDDALGSGGVPRYDHRQVDQIPYAEATFAVRESPDRAKPGADWLRDVFLSVNDRLKTYRLMAEEGQYRVVQTNAVAYPSGVGPAAFWDSDADGDLDLFRMGAYEDGRFRLVLFPNMGAAYAPAWGEFAVIEDIPVDGGGIENGFREELYTFADYDRDGNTEFLLQRQDGALRVYDATPAKSGDSLPTFKLTVDDFAEAVDPEHGSIEPRGLAVADFDGFLPVWDEIFLAYAHAEGACFLFFDPQIRRTLDMSNALATMDGGTLDPNGIQALAAGDLDLDGNPDLVIAWSPFSDYAECEHLIYRNEDDPFDPIGFKLTPAGSIQTSYKTDLHFARMPSFADLDGDGDDDLFVAHRHPPNSNLQSYVRFYRNTGFAGLQYVRFRVVAEQERPLHLTLTTQSQVVDVAPEYTEVQNTSGGEMFANAVYRTGATAPAVDIFDTTNLIADYNFTEVRAFVDVVPPVEDGESKAIIVVGATADDSLYPAFSSLAGYAYRILISEGLSKGDIRLLAAASFDADQDDVNDVHGPPSLAAVEDALLTWALGGKSDSLERLLVYFIDHGKREGFRLNETEYLEPETYAGWLDTLQENDSKDDDLTITTLFDSCEAGSFVDDLAGENRITITSAGVGPIEGVALFDQSEFISFSLHFWTRIYNGDTYGKAFREAKTAIESINPLQVPQIDDDGNGVANEASDGLVADGMRPGAIYEVQGPGVFIGDVAPNQTITGDSATLWLADVVTPFPVEDAKAIVVPPNFDRPTSGSDDEQPVSELPSVLFTHNDTLKRWEGTYSGFDQGGLFQIQYFVKTGGQYYASPRIGFVDRIDTPDAWEDDDTAATANWAAVNGVQGHNFHDQDDEDWVRFTSPLNEMATIALIEPRTNCRPVVELYRASAFEEGGKATPLRTEESAEAGAELIFEHAFNESEPYLLRVRNYDGEVFGEGTSYFLLVAVGTGGELLSSTLVVTAVSEVTGQAVEGASVLFDNRSIGKTTAEGIAHVVVPNYGTYTVTANLEGVGTASQVVQVNNFVESVLLHLGEGTPPAPPGKFLFCGVAPDSGGGRLGDAAVMLLVFGVLLWRGYASRCAATRRPGEN